MKDIEFQIFAEIGALRYRVCAYRYGRAMGYLSGFLNPRTQMLKLYPERELTRGGLDSVSRKYPILVYMPDLPWKKTPENNQENETNEATVQNIPEMQE